MAEQAESSQTGQSQAEDGRTESAEAPDSAGGTEESVPEGSVRTNGGEVIALSALEHQDENAASVVYFTSDISPEAMTEIYHALGEGFSGENIAVKLSTGEPPASNYTAGESHTSPWGGEQDPFTESMAEAGKSVVDALDGNILYVSVMNHLSVDCDCDGNPAEPDMHDMGILASSDPVALDQACVDLVYASQDDTASLIERMESRNAVHVLEHGEEIGLGSRSYQMVSIDG